MALTLLSCQGPVDPGIELVEANGSMIPKINVEQIEKEKIILFTDWFENIRLVELEASENSLIERVLNAYVGEEHIIVCTMRSGVLQFTIEGKFVKTLAKRGKGPGEISDFNTRIFVDEPANKVYISLGYIQGDKVLCVDISSGKHEYLSYANTGSEPMRDCPVVKNNLMYCANITFTGQSSAHPVFCQTTSGKLIWEIEKNGPKNSPNARTHLVDDQLFFQYTRGDTLFKIQDDKLLPHLIISSTETRANFPKVHENEVDYGIKPLIPNWYLGYFIYINKVDWEQQREGFPKIEYSKRTRFLYNQKKHEVFRIGESIVNDYLGSTTQFDLSIQTNGIAFARYQALDLYEYADSAKQSPDLDSKVKEVLYNILNRIEVDGNPYLLIGTIKKGI